MNLNEIPTQDPGLTIALATIKKVAKVIDIKIEDEKLYWVIVEGGDWTDAGFSLDWVMRHYGPGGIYRP